MLGRFDLENCKCHSIGQVSNPAFWPSSMHFGRSNTAFSFLGHFWHCPKHWACSQTEIHHNVANATIPACANVMQIGLTSEGWTDHTECSNCKAGSGKNSFSLPAKLLIWWACCMAQVWPSNTIDYPLVHPCTTSVALPIFHTANQFVSHEWSITLSESLFFMCSFPCTWEGGWASMFTTNGKTKKRESS